MALWWLTGILPSIIAIEAPHPLRMIVAVVPTAILIGLAALPYLDRNPARRPGLRKVAVATFTAFMVLWIVLTIIGFAFRGPNWEWTWPWEEWHGEL